jgi:hypothetical protein
MPVHDVDVDPVGAGLFRGGDRLAELGEISRKDGGRELQFSISCRSSCPGGARLAE